MSVLVAVLQGQRVLAREKGILGGDHGRKTVL